MNRFLMRARSFLFQLRDMVRARLGGASEERVVGSEPRSTAGSPEHRSSVPASIDSAHYSDVRQVPEGEAVAREQRHEVSSLFGSHPLAPSAEASGRELVDPGAVEVPLGQTADPAFHDELDHQKLPQPESTGASLQLPYEQSSAMLEDEETESLIAGEIPFGELTAIPKREAERELFPFEEEHYDALDPEDLGATFLSRATEDRNLGRRDEWDDDLAELEIDRDALHGGVVPHLTGEATRASALAGEDELGEIEELHRDPQLRDTIPLDVENRRRKESSSRARSR